MKDVKKRMTKQKIILHLISLLGSWVVVTASSTECSYSVITQKIGNTSLSFFLFLTFPVLFFPFQPNLFFSSLYISFSVLSSSFHSSAFLSRHFIACHFPFCSEKEWSSSNPLMYVLMCKLSLVCSHCTRCSVALILMF